MTTTTTIPTITESTILTSYLLHPSPLPTILPYSAFLNLVPISYRNNPTSSTPLKRLYRDLQFQRSITVEQVRDSIERECGAKAATHRAQLARHIAIEEGDRAAELEAEEEMKRKRKRRRMSTNEGWSNEDGAEHTPQVKKEDLSDSEMDEFTDPLHLAAQQTLHDHPSSLHPAAHVLSAPAHLDQAKFGSAARFHTKESLVSAMENASVSLAREIEELEAECARVKVEIVETVSGLSDLRYGRRQRESDGGEGAHQFGDVLEAVEEFRELVREKTSAPN